jgi:hypothetical protein
MVARPVRVTLEAAGGETTSADGVLREFSVMDRTRRALITLGAGLLCVAVLIPIPIIHLLGIPLALIASVVISIRQFSSTARLDPVRLPCPKCAGINRIGGGLGLRHPKQPVERMCDDCRRHLQLRMTDL